METPKNIGSEFENKTTEDEKEEYLYGCFLGYRDALYLGRTLDGLMKLHKVLETNSKVNQQITDYASSCIRMILPNIKIPGWTNQEFLDLLSNEAENRELSSDDLMDKIEQDSELLREKIEAGEIDIWDDSPTYVDRAECTVFMKEALELIKTKVVPACNPKESLLEALTKGVVDLLEKNNNYQQQRGYQALLILWDSARMFHEGEPPFKIAFSAQVAAQLGIDPIMESIRCHQMKSLKKGSYEAKKAKAALSVCLNSYELNPHLLEISKVLFSKIEFEG